MWTVNNSEFVSWAAEESLRIDLGGGVEKYHAVFCDPPYGIKLMGMGWDDHGGPLAFQQQAEIWGKAMLPLLRPGALVFMFTGTRMWHRLACGMESAGFEMWDTINWCSSKDQSYQCSWFEWYYAQGFPKGQDISKMIDKEAGNTRPVIGKSRRHNSRPFWSGVGDADFGTFAGGVPDETAPGSEVSAPWSGYRTPQLKPSHEPILCFRAPSDGLKYVELALEHGSGALNVDGARINYTSEKEAKHQADICRGQENATNGRFFGGKGKSVASTNSPQGRYPANLALECICENPEEIDAPINGDVSGNEPSEPTKNVFGDFGRVPFKAYRGKMVKHTDPDCPGFQLDAQSVESDGASRFFFCAKVTRRERQAGLTGSREQSDDHHAEGPPTNNHPSVKPITLTKWLATLLLPPTSAGTRRLLIPFSGVASEMIGAVQAGWDEVVGVEMEPEYCTIAEARLTHWEREK